MRKFILLFFSLIFICCEKTDIINDNTSGSTIIANSVKNYLYGCPEFFIPPVYGNPTGTIRNSTGAVAWTPSGLTGYPAKVETKEGYRKRIDNATRKDIM